jgi:hypothetical protein
LGRQIVSEDDARKANEAHLQRILGEVRNAVIDYIGMNGPIQYANQIMPYVEKRLRGNCDE